MAIENFSEFSFVILIGLFSLYSVIASLLVYSAVVKVTGKELKRLLFLIFLILYISFFIGLYNIAVSLDIINFDRFEIMRLLDRWIILIVFFGFVIYLSFLAREIGNKFGFRHVGREIKTKFKSRKDH